MSTVGPLPRAKSLARARVRQLIGRLGLLADSGHTVDATLYDVVSAYRMLLGREPDQAGLAFYRERLRRGSLVRKDLVRELVTSIEFSRAWPELGRTSHRTSEAVDVGDFTIMVDPADWAVGRTISDRHVYEPEVTATVRSLLHPGGVFVDAGANIGWYSLLAAELVGPSGAVLSIEPNLGNCELVRASLERNGFSQIDLVAGALSDTSGWLALETDASNGRVIALGSVNPTTTPIACSYAVPAFTLDQLLEERGLLASVDVIKVDVEGVETQVFAGAPHLLGGTRPAVVFEWYPEALRSTGATDPTAPLDLLRSHGYDISVIATAQPGEVGGCLSNEAIDQVRKDLGRDLLDLVAIHRG